jgi:hypothetical protein
VLVGQALLEVGYGIGKNDAASGRKRRESIAGPARRDRQGTLA